MRQTIRRAAAAFVLVLAAAARGAGGAARDQARQLRLSAGRRQGGDLHRQSRGDGAGARRRDLGRPLHGARPTAGRSWPRARTGPAPSTPCGGWTSRPSRRSGQYHLFSPTLERQVLRLRGARRRPRARLPRRAQELLPPALQHAEARRARRRLARPGGLPHGRPGDDQRGRPHRPRHAGPHGRMARRRRLQQVRVGRQRRRASCSCSAPTSATRRVRRRHRHPRVRQRRARRARRGEVGARLVPEDAAPRRLRPLAHARRRTSSPTRRPART